MKLLSRAKGLFGFARCGLHPRIDILTSVKNILGFAGGGVHKRIDENRELLELLQRDAPVFLESHPWVEGWIASNDEFFVSLEKTVPISKGRFLCQALSRSESFPRPWPGKGDRYIDFRGRENT